MRRGIRDGRERGGHPSIGSRVRLRVRRPPAEPARPGPAAPLLRAPPLHPRTSEKGDAIRRRRRDGGRRRRAGRRRRPAASPRPRLPSRGQAPGPSRRGRVRPDPAPASHRARRRRGHPSRHTHTRDRGGVPSERPRPVRRVLRRVVDAVGQRQTSGDGVKRRRSGAVAGDWDREGGDREGRGRGLAQVPRARQVRRRRAGDARRPVHGSQGEGDAAIVSKKRRPGRPRRFKRREGGRERGRRAS
mmetsp:Transcript_11339/g.45762  ORF Transcript_11339/g.45762 Transcript_11339/m.45762 type:complete len:245 (-) Transcript_11339:2423-3157(-)